MARGGKREGAGRKKGSLNKENKQLREMILEALELADKGGGVEYLAKQARERPNAFLPLLGRVLPLQVAGDPDSPLKASLEVSFVRSKG